MFYHYQSIASPLDLYCLRNLFSIDTPLLASMNLSIANIGLYMTIAAFIAFYFSVLATNHSKITHNSSLNINFKIKELLPRLFLLLVIFISIYEGVSLVVFLFSIARLLSNDMVRLYLLIQYKLYYRSKVLNTLKNYISKCKNNKYLCCSAILITRVDILESVVRNIETRAELLREARLNTAQTKQPLEHEIVNLSKAKLSALQLAHKDVQELAQYERRNATSPDVQKNISVYLDEAEHLYESGIKAIKASVGIDNIGSSS